jgi:hypothetical protein
MDTRPVGKWQGAALVPNRSPRVRASSAFGKAFSMKAPTISSSGADTKSPGFCFEEGEL